MSEAKQYSALVGDKLITVETGRLAKLAQGAVTIRCGDTLLLVAVSMAKEPRPGINFFPLSVDYEEKIYAAGRIPGSYFRREGRPSTGAILIDRLTDRPLRPMFPKGFKNDIQIVITPLSVDEDHQPDMLAIMGASAALAISNAPFGGGDYDGPVGAVRVGYIDGELVANPTYAEMENSTLDLRLAGTSDAISMVECGADEVTEDIMVKALAFGHAAMQPFIEMQKQMVAEVGKEKIVFEVPAVNEALTAEVSEKVLVDVNYALTEYTDKAERSKALDDIKEALLAGYVNEDDADNGALLSEVKDIFQAVYKAEIRRRITEEGVRPDGRSTDQIRHLSADTGLAPRTHGSGLFTRGETQVLSLATLGTPREAQELDTLSPHTTVRYMHHYNFPPYSVGETGRVGSPKRREIGHGELARQAILPLLPSKEEFPYTIRVVSEVLSSNGSTSMASVCGSTLSLMNAGVPLKKPVGGIAMGLINEGDNYAVLTDIQGLEDHLGDMDFKVAGTVDGITALQMDIKIKGIPADVMARALAQAKVARLEIIKVMTDHIAAPAEMSDYAPRMESVKIDPELIGALIGPGGKNIRAIQEETGAKLDIDEDGTVFIASADGVAMKAAIERVLLSTAKATAGDIYTGPVVRIEPFGAFVTLFPGTDGLVHISQMASERIESVESVANIGDEITVMVTAVDDRGKVRLSRKAVLEGWTLEEAIENDNPRKGGGGGRGGRGGGDRGRGRGGDRGGRGGDRRGGGGGRR